MQIETGCFQQNSTISDNSSAVMKSGLPSRARYSSKLICMPLWIFVRMYPGAMLMTRMPFFASASRNDSPKARTACLLAV